MSCDASVWLYRHRNGTEVEMSDFWLLFFDTNFLLLYNLRTHFEGLTSSSPDSGHPSQSVGPYLRGPASCSLRDQNQQTQTLPNTVCCLHVILNSTHRILDRCVLLFLIVWYFDSLLHNQIWLQKSTSTFLPLEYLITQPEAPFISPVNPTWWSGKFWG